MEVLGDVKADFISLVPTPRLRNMDQPYPEDLTSFEENLAKALKTQIDRAVNRPQIDLSLIEDTLAAFTWEGIFDKVQGVYYNVLQD